MTHYEVLGIKPEATKDQVKEAYLKQTKIWHPDKKPKDQEEAAKARFLLIYEAYKVLSDPERRCIYDNELISEQKSSEFKSPYSSTSMPSSSFSGNYSSSSSSASAPSDSNNESKSSPSQQEASFEEADKFWKKMEENIVKIGEIVRQKIEQEKKLGKDLLNEIKNNSATINKVQTYISASARLDVEDENRFRTLDHAILSGRYDIVQLLIKSGANCRYYHPFSWNTPLHLAMIASSRDIQVQKLLVNEAKQVTGLFIFASHCLDARNKEGKTPLHLALETQQYDIARLLMQAGADCTIDNPSYPYHLHGYRDAPDDIKKHIEAEKKKEPKSTCLMM